MFCQERKEVCENVLLLEPEEETCSNRFSVTRVAIVVYHSFSTQTDWQLLVRFSLPRSARRLRSECTGVQFGATLYTLHAVTWAPSDRKRDSRFGGTVPGRRADAFLPLVVRFGFCLMVCGEGGIGMTQTEMQTSCRCPSSSDKVGSSICLFFTVIRRYRVVVNWGTIIIGIFKF